MTTTEMKATDFKTNSDILEGVFKSAVDAMWFAVRGGVKSRELERVAIRYFASNGDITQSQEHYNSRSVQKNTITAKRNSKALAELRLARIEIEKLSAHYLALVEKEVAEMDMPHFRKSTLEAQKTRIRRITYSFNSHLKAMKKIMDDRANKLHIAKEHKAA